MLVGIALIRILFSKMAIVGLARGGLSLLAINDLSSHFVYILLGRFIGGQGKTERDMDQHLLVFVPFFVL